MLAQNDAPPTAPSVVARRATAATSLPSGSGTSTAAAAGEPSTARRIIAGLPGYDAPSTGRTAASGPWGAAEPLAVAQPQLAPEGDLSGGSGGRHASIEARPPAQ